MAQFQDERRIITENSSDPTHGEREKSQEEEQQQQVADDLNDQPGGDEHEAAGDQPQKKSMLQKVKDTAKTLIHKHVYLFGNDDGETEDHHQFEDAEENHENFTREEEKEDTDGMKKEKEHDFNSNLNNKPADGSAVSPGLDALSTRNLSNDSDVAKDQELANLGIQSVSPDANVVAADYEPGSTSDRAAMLAETAGLQQEAAMVAETTKLQQGVATVPGQLPAGIPPILQSTEAATTAYPYDDGQTDKFLDKYMVHQVHDINTTDIPTSATHPVQSEFSQAVPNLAPYSRQEEAPENQLYWDDESEKIEYSDSFAKGPRAPEGMMEHITEEPTVETIHIQEAAEDRWFDANDVVAGAPSLEDQSCSLSHPSLEQFAVTESISGEVEYGDQDRVWGTDIDAHADVSDELQDLRAKEAESPM